MKLKQAAALALMLALPAFAANQTVVFSTQFANGSIPPEIDPGRARVHGVEGFAGYGHAGRKFAGSFLRSPDGNRVKLTLANLPPHQYLDLDFLFAAIDSLDGSGDQFPYDDNFAVRIDGKLILRESFANATDTQSYVAPPGGTLARMLDLGFGQRSYDLDSAYDMSVEPRFRNIPHTASTAAITFDIEGVGKQELIDESWAFDNLSVSVADRPVQTLYSQMSDDAGYGILSANFDDTLYDARAADEFVVTQPWTITEVDVAGVYFPQGGTGTARSVNVTFYKSNANGKLPGAIVKNLPNRPYVDTTGNGSFNIQIPPLALAPGVYWVSVQANMVDLSVNEWAWENREPANGQRAAWKNPQDGFGTGCTRWRDEATCIGVGGGDHMFAIKGMLD